MTAIPLLPFLVTAFDELFKADSELFALGTNGISEQTLTFRLGYYLQKRFSNHHVDCEYNRLEGKLKTDPHVDKKWMKPDVIVHRRIIKRDNLIVIEAKKAAKWKKGWNEIDQKLKAFTRRPGNYEYRLGLAWKIAFSGNPNDHEAVWFVKGQEILTTSLLKFDGNLIAALKQHGN